MPSIDEKGAFGPLPEQLNAFTLELMADLRRLRAGEITVHDARVRAQLAREVLRSVHLQLEGVRWLAEQAKPVPGIEAG